VPSFSCFYFYFYFVCCEKYNFFVARLLFVFLLSRAYFRLVPYVVRLFGAGVLARRHVAVPTKANNALLVWISTA